MSMTAALIPEFEQEAGTTRRVLERVPNDKLDWRPHEKSMTLGQLARHVASCPGDIARLAELDNASMEEIPGPPPLTSAAELLTLHDEGLETAKRVLGAMSDEAALRDWSFLAGGKPLVTVPRIGFIRTIMLNHWIHHRGQLSVYLRLLDVPVPSIYGPSADENPFG